MSITMTPGQQVVLTFTFSSALSQAPSLEIIPSSGPIGCISFGSITGSGTTWQVTITAGTESGQVVVQATGLYGGVPVVTQSTTIIVNGTSSLGYSTNTVTVVAGGSVLVSLFPVQPVVLPWVITPSNSAVATGSTPVATQIPLPGNIVSTTNTWMTQIVGVAAGSSTVEYQATDSAGQTTSVTVTVTVVAAPTASTTSSFVPTVSSATVGTNGTAFTVVFSENVNCSSGAGITVVDGANNYTTTYVSGTGTNTLVFTVSSTVHESETVTWNYAAGSGNIVASTGSAPLASFVGASITNNSTS